MHLGTVARITVATLPGRYCLFIFLAFQAASCFCSTQSRAWTTSQQSTVTSQHWEIPTIFFTTFQYCSQARPTSFGESSTCQSVFLSELRTAVVWDSRSILFVCLPLFWMLTCKTSQEPWWPMEEEKGHPWPRVRVTWIKACNKITVSTSPIV